MIEVQELFFKLCQLLSYDSAYDFSVNASQMTQEPISEVLKPLCLVVPFNGSSNYPSRPSFSLSEGSSVLKIASSMVVFVLFRLDALPAYLVMLTGMCLHMSIFSGLLGEL